LGQVHVGSKHRIAGVSYVERKITKLQLCQEKNAASDHHDSWNWLAMSKTSGFSKLQMPSGCTLAVHGKAESQQQHQQHQQH
jgi:hypothetical protein